MGVSTEDLLSPVSLWVEENPEQVVELVGEGFNVAGDRSDPRVVSLTSRSTRAGLREERCPPTRSPEVSGRVPRVGLPYR